MNIEESKSLLSWVSLNKLYIDTHNECDYHNIHTAIETLLTAYEKEKELLELASNMLDNIDYDQIPIAIGELKSELEKEKEKNKELEKKLEEINDINFPTIN